MIAYEGHVRRGTPSYVFAMEVCLPRAEIKKCIDKKMEISEISKKFKIYRDFVIEACQRFEEDSAAASIRHV